jgi:hypothetical protein
MSVAPLRINGMKAGASAEFVLAFTGAHRAYAHVHPARREAACLKAQFPAILLLPEPGDLFAGRRNYQPVGFDADMALGYTYSETAMQALMERFRPGSLERRDLADCAAYWRGENTAFKIRRAYPPDVVAALPKDNPLFPFPDRLSSVVSV